MTPEEDGITFEVDRLALGSDGQLEISGRWYGVRGRRFMRPTLTLTLKDDSSEQRVLAGLEHKPWAAQDGDAWRAVFPFGGPLDGAERIELAVAPDITVELVGGSGPRVNTGRAAELRPAGSTRSPVVRDDPARPRPRAPRAPEIVRLRERLALAESAITRARTRRQADDEALEAERQSARTLQAEVGRLRAELDLAGAVARELDTASRSMDDLRGQARELRSERDRLAGERDDAQRELAQERSGASDGGGEPGGETERKVPNLLPRTERPLNPSLRGSHWLGRGIALVLIMIVVAAIVVVINSTVS